MKDKELRKILNKQGVIQNVNSGEFDFLCNDKLCLADGEKNAQVVNDKIESLLEYLGLEYTRFNRYQIGKGAISKKYSPKKCKTAQK